MKKYIMVDTRNTLKASIRGDTTSITWGFILNFKSQYGSRLFELHFV